MTQSGPNLTTTLTNYPDGDLARVTTPYGGYLRWEYAWISLSGGRQYREVQNRYLFTNNGVAENRYMLQRLGSDSNQSIHTYADWFDFTGNAEKVWWFQTGTTATNAGLATGYEERSYIPRVTLSHNDYTWTTDGVGNPYIASTLSTLGTVQKNTAQTLDNYGNVTQTQLFDWASLSTPARTYNNTYLINPGYSSKYILNRLLSSTVTPAGGAQVTLVTNTYDLGPADVIGMQEHDPTYTQGYTTRGNLATSTSLGTVSSYYYDIGGNITSKGVNGLTVSATTSSNTNFAVPGTITANSTLTTTMNYNAALAVSSQTGPNGETAAIGYDTNSRPTSTTSPYSAITYFTYNDAASPPTKTATTGNRAVITSMDGFGRPIKVQTLDTGVVKSIVDTQYAPCACSPLGKLSKQSLPYVTGGPSWTVYTYDALGRTLTSTAPDGSTTTYAYANNTVTVTDPATHSKTFAMDAFGNLSNVTEPNPTGGYFFTYYGYDVLNHLTSVSMPRGSATQTRSFNYGNPPGAYLLSATNPETGTVNYTYNTDGTLATKGALVYGYDPYKRLLTVTNSGVTLRTYSYDTNPYDGSYSQNAWGRLTAVQYTRANGDTFTDMFSYWAPGAVYRKRLRVARTVWTGARLSADIDAAYAYDNEGRMNSVTYPTTYDQGDGNSPSAFNPRPIAGPVYVTSYDPLGRASGMTQNGTALVSNVQYGVAGELRQMTTNMGLETRDYNSLFQLTQITASGLNIQYAYPAAGANNGKIASQTDAFTAETVTYAYDSLNRLISANSTIAGQSQTFGYDGFGNLVSKPPLSVNVDPATNRITLLTYDGNGNVISQPGMPSNYNYDAENRMTSAPGVQYGYDGQNKRNYKAAVNSGGAVISEEFYFYGVSGQKLGTYYLQQVAVGSLYGVTLTFSSTSPFTLIANTPTVYFRGRVLAPQDRLGSIGKYYPYGEEKGTQTGNDALKFATYTRDAATGLDYADQRYYSSQFGRFMTADPYMASGGPGDPGSWNRYAYTRSDPVNRVDPDGLADFSVTGYCNGCSTFGPGLLGIGLPDYGFAQNTALQIQNTIASIASYFGDLAAASKQAHDSLIGTDLQLAKGALANKDCSKHFGTPATRAQGWDPAAALSVMYSDSGGYIGGSLSYVGFLTSNFVPSAASTIPFVFIGGSAKLAAGYLVAISSQDWNFVQGLGVNGDGAKMNAATLLHELAHIYADIGGSGGTDIKYDAYSSAVSQGNQALLLKDCFGISTGGQP